MTDHVLTQPFAVDEKVLRSLYVQCRDEPLEKAKRRYLDGPEARLQTHGIQSGSTLIVTNGVAVVPVRGVLTRQPYWRGDQASYEWIAARVDEAMGRPDVQRVVLMVDSPGGQIAGVEDLASLIYGARGSKPVDAYVLGQAASAAYWIASAADRILVGRTSLAGSIGVVWTTLDFSKYNARVGIEEINIVSSQSPDKHVDPKDDHGRARIQTTVDQLAAVFVADVARNRGVSESTVTGSFGGGWVQVGEEAVRSGMVDGLATFSEALASRTHAAGTGSVHGALARSQRFQPRRERRQRPRIASRERHRRQQRLLCAWQLLTRSRSPRRALVKQAAQARAFHPCLLGGLV